MKHTPGPWYVDQKTTHKFGRIKNCFVIRSSKTFESLAAVYNNTTNAERIVACVNSLEGIEDPEDFVQKSKVEEK